MCIINHLAKLYYVIINFFCFQVTICEADSTTNTDSESTVDYGSDSNDSSDSSKSDYYSHSEPEFVEDVDSESDSENRCPDCNPKVLMKTKYV